MADEQTEVSQQDVALSNAGYDFVCELIQENQKLRQRIEVLEERLMQSKEEDH